ncbi:STAS domain-containing protein [Actinomadura rudentiformis]|uniref:Anti-sigma factor antagonist n=1 Tax=Actinomadura rudentiformis TaxID=359158 RepID=A0A6H9YN10_9ACTN|nr:STAS domain-containing protein [Actinomadura rudentiformis]KAB2341107.1 STAS domain-containing protein [Actinomadura rudentiformis]
MNENRKPGGRSSGRRGPLLRCRGTETEPAVGSGNAAGSGSAEEPLPGLRVTVVQANDDLAVLAVSGEIDLHTADTLRTALRELDTAGHHQLVVDFSGVSFCDATGLGALVSAHNRAGEHGGALRLAGVRPAQRRLLQISGLHRVLASYGNVADAVAQVRPVATKAFP